MQLGIGMPIGYQADAVAMGDPATHRLNDTFSTNRAAGAVHNTDPEPGPGGKRGVLDTNGKFSIADGALVGASGAVGNFDPVLVYQNPVDRVVGQCLFVTITVSAGRVQIGAVNAATLSTASLSGLRRGSFDLNGTALAVAPASSGSIAVGNVVLSTTYEICIVFRAAGAWYFIKGGAFTNWTLIWFDSVATDKTLYLYIANLGTTTAFTVSEIAAPLERFAPDPIASDGFSSWGSTDGAGHAEGIAGGRGSGGAGLSWTAAVGTWGASGGVAAATALSGGIAIATISATANILVRIRVTWVSGKAGLVLRRGGTTNYIYVVHTGTHIQVYKRILNSETSLFDGATTYVANAELMVSIEGSALRVAYNGLLVTTQTISESQVASSPLVGVYTTSTDNTFDSLIVYGRGTNGEHVALDTL